MARLPLQHAALLDNYTLISQNQLFPLMKCIDLLNNMCRMGRWSFWSWFDENRSTFDEDMPEKDFYIFVPGDLGLRFKFIFDTNTNALTNVLHYITLRYVTICFPSYSCLVLCFL